MKSIKNIFLTAIAAALVLTSCKDSDDDYSYSVGTQSAGSYLTAAKSSFVFTPGQEQVLTLQLGRTDASAAEKVTLEGNNPVFQVPTSVSFAAGEKEKPLNIPFTLATGETAKLTVKITSATSVYAADSIVVSVMCDYVWESLGTGKYYDSFFFNEPAEVEILQCTSIPNKYRVVAPYAKASLQDGVTPLNAGPSEIDFIIYKAGDTFAEQTLDYDGLVGYDDIHTGLDVGYDQEVIAYHPASGFKSYPTPDTWAYNKVLVYQDVTSNGVTLPGQVQFAPFYYMDGLGGWDYASSDGDIIITFPGYNPKDYSVAFSYQGRQSNIFGTADFAYGVLTLGADAASVKVAVATDETFDAVEAGLKDGTVEGITVEKSGAVQIPGVDGTGYYYAIMVVFNADGEAVASDYVRFFYLSSKEQWTKLFDGTYTYEADIIELLDDNYSFYEGTLTSAVYKSTTTEGLYTIKPWGNAKANFGLVFYWDTETNEISVDGADTGDEDIYEYEGEEYNDGKVTFYTLDMLGLPIASGYDPATKTFTFNGIYVNEAEFYYGGVVETFVVNDGAASAPKFLKRAPQFKAHAKKHQLTFAMKRALSRIKLQHTR